MRELSLAGVAAAIAVAAFLWFTQARDEGAAQRARADVERGRYLVLAANCLTCHTPRGEARYAGGRAIPTPFGTLYSPNITPDRETGIGSWSADDFWRALHEGRGKDGALLYPAFPYTNYTRVRREDADAMYAYLMTLPPVNKANRAHEMRFPYDQRNLLAGWRALYFRQGVFRPDPKRSAEWNRGAYLVEALGHCSACHGERNALGAVVEERSPGGLIPMLDWYAPSLTSSREAGLGAREVPELVELLRTGVSERAAVFGPMAEVVRDSLQHLSEEDLGAIVAYLKAQQADEDEGVDAGLRVAQAHAEELRAAGAKIYEARCAGCHQPGGEGVPRVYPRLAGNRSLLMANPVNAIRMTLNGGFPPSTQGNPRPYGMPSFAHQLSDEEVASVVTYVRSAWGNAAPPVSPGQVAAARGVPLD